MVDVEISRREENERQAFSRVGTEGRSAIDDEASLALPDSTIERYGSRLRGEAAPRTPLEQMFTFLGPSIEGKRVLEICCHTCEYGTILARLGADVTSVDIAEPLIDIARRRARVNGVEARLKPLVMSVHAMKFLDAQFDVVFGKAALHHLDLAAARSEILRVMKPGGVAVFNEPVSFSPTLAALRERLRWIKPDRESPDERPLTAVELAEFCRPFQSREVAYYRLFLRLDRVFPRAGILLSGLDRALLQAAPVLRRAAGQVVFRLAR